MAAFGFIAVSSRDLGLDDYVPIGQLWSIWAVSFAVISFTSQQTVVRSQLIRRADASGPVVTADELLPLLLLIVPLAVAVIGWREELFRSASPWWPALALVMPMGTLLTGTTRGSWAATGRVGGLAFVIAAENSVRLVAAVILRLMGASAPWYAAAIVLGFAVGFVRPPRIRVSPWRLAPLVEPELAVTTAGVGLIAHGAQVGAPLVLALRGAPAHEVSALFAILAVYRAPYQLVLGLVPRVAAVRAAALADGGEVDPPPRVRLLGLLALVSLAGGGCAALIGEVVVAPLFDAENILSGVDHALGAMLVVLGIAALGLTVLRVSTGHSRPLALRWVVAGGVGVSMLATSGDHLTGVLLALVVMEIVAVLSLAEGKRAEWEPVGPSTV